MNLLALFLLPTVMQPLPDVMPFADVVQREHEQQAVWVLPVNKLKGLKAVNDYWNSRIKYTVNGEIWQTPEQTFERATGDCKDYAIAKYYSLRHLGYSASRLKITIVLWRGQQWHAVLVVDNDAVLDNLNKNIVLVKDIDQYEAAYSVNEESLWTLTKVK